MSRGLQAGSLSSAAPLEAKSLSHECTVCTWSDRCPWSPAPPPPPPPLPRKKAEKTHLAGARVRGPRPPGRRPLCPHLRHRGAGQSAANHGMFPGAPGPGMSAVRRGRAGSPGEESWGDTESRAREGVGADPAARRAEGTPLSPRCLSTLQMGKLRHRAVNGGVHRQHRVSNPGHLAAKLGGLNC